MSAWDRAKEQRTEQIARDNSQGVSADLVARGGAGGPVIDSDVSADSDSWAASMLRRGRR